MKKTTLIIANGFIQEVIGASEGHEIEIRDYDAVDGVLEEDNIGDRFRRIKMEP